MKGIVYPLIGLGNPGSDYAQTRHNAGFWLVQNLAEKLGLVFSKPLLLSLWRAECSAPALKALYTDLAFAPGLRLALIMPQTFMNCSGDILDALYQSWLCKGYEIAKPIVAVDQMDLAPGELRLKSKGGTAGHNGLKSLSAILGTDFYPLYIGVGRPSEGQSVIDHVLGQADAEDQAKIDAVMERACRSVALCLASGVDTAMAFCNARN